MKRFLLTILCLLILPVCFYGCSNKSQSSQIDTSNYDYNGIMQTAHYGGSYTIYYDKNTKVMYVLYNSSSGGEFTLMLDSKGKPQVYNQNNEYSLNTVYYGGDYTVYCESNTKVMYLLKNSSSGAVFTVMVNPDGTPQVYNGE